VIQRLSRRASAHPNPLSPEFKDWLRAEATRERFRTRAAFPAYATPAQFKGFVDGQIALWLGVIDKEGLTMNTN
jgi:tripartite-type tricarboxylate transporter receptor subunit TctC